MKVKNGDSVKVHYIGTLNDGNEFDNSYKRGSTLDFQVGGGQMIKGFDNALVEMEVGQKKTVNLKAEEAYGPRREEAIMAVAKENFPPDFEAKEGEMVQGRTENGQPINALIIEVQENDIILDMNHPLAGEELNFEIELVEIS
jgi:FKBP-type peptidyl-prolyl cis-trans isomerase 2